MDGLQCFMLLVCLLCMYECMKISETVFHLCFSKSLVYFICLFLAHRFVLGLIDN
jgi:hypothetical protein